MHHQAPPQSFVKSSALVLALAACFAAEPRLTGVDEISYPKLLDAQRGKVVLVDFWAWM